MKIFGYDYLIGNPAIRDKIATVETRKRISANFKTGAVCVVLAFAFIGLCWFAYAMNQILSW